MGYKTPVFPKSCLAICHACGWKKNYNLSGYRKDKKGILLTVSLKKQKEVVGKYGLTVLEIIDQSAEEIGLKAVKVLLKKELIL